MKPAEPIMDRHHRPVRFVALERQHTAIEPRLHGAFVRLIGSSASTLGAEVERFEAEFAAYSQVAQCVGVGSGTAALALMLEACGIGPGDEVIIPAHMCSAAALAVAQVDATPVLCDVEDNTGLIDADSARRMVGPRTAAVLAVHLYGQVCNMAALEAFAKPAGLMVLEDVAHAHGARYCGHRAGSLGAAAAISFHPTSNLGALGGAVCTDDDVLAARLRRLRNLGQRTNRGHVERGYHKRLDGLQAALLRVKLPYLDGWNRARRDHAAQYQELLPQTVRLLKERSESPCAYHLFPIRLEDRDAVAGRLRTAGIETGIHYSPALHAHPAWRDRRMVYADLPIAEAWASEVLSLPMHPDLRPDEIERVAEAMHAALPARGAVDSPGKPPSRMGVYPATAPRRRQWYPLHRVRAPRGE